MTRTINIHEAKTHLSRLAEEVVDLPSVHRDPFDRMLVAQSIAEPMRLLTHDDRLAEYGSTILLV